MSNYICVVMAVHNRINNVRKALKAWSLQTRKDFTLVVSDDASIDPIRALVLEYSAKLQVKHVYTGGVLPRTAPVALNVGTRAAPPETTHIWYTDGDILFGTEAMKIAYQHLEEFPGRVIAGRYDWLPPPEEKGIRPDHRKHVYGDTWFNHTLLDSCGAVLGSNVIIPLQAWHDIGGWDEFIPGANANDCDFGWCLTDAGYKMVTCECIKGLHQHHERNKKFLAAYKISLPYIFRKHGKPVPEQWKQYDTYEDK